MTGRATRAGLALFAAVLLTGFAVAQQQVAKARPRILLIGDRGFDNHFGNAARSLQDRADLVRAPLGFLPTGAALQRVDELLAGGPWDLIVFNFGVNDLMHRDPRSRQIRAMSPAAGGVPVTSLDDYAAHLRQLAARFAASGTRLLWVTTLPLHPQRRSTALIPSDLARYAASASQVVTELAIPVFDAHAQVRAVLDAVENPRAVDRAHNDLFKGDLSAPLVARMGDLLDR